ncbi:MAG TPA: helix-turn-helix transcriptional regulator [Candidatus Kapabacteria bacterium]|nr:helix-turn-helix transcriptional regulator [Candidatus Kapabacteria bacterium]
MLSHMDFSASLPREVPHFKSIKYHSEIIKAIGEKFLPRRVKIEGNKRKLKEIRKQLKIRQKVMAQNLEIPASYLCDIEGGKGNPGPDFFIKNENLLTMYG